MATRKDWEIVKIGDKEYSFVMIPPEDSIKLSLSVVEAFGGIVASLIPVLGVDSEEFDVFDIDWSSINVAEVQSSLMTAVAHVEPAKIFSIFEATLGFCFEIDANGKGQRCKYDMFNGRIKTMYLVLFYALRYNYADFFGVSVEG